MGIQVVLFILIPLVLLLGGIVLYLYGRRGRRVDDHPICRRCGFDLFGLPETSKVCSECGTDLQSPAAVRIGRRERRRGLVAWGLTIFLLSAGWLGLLGWAAFSDIDWNRQKPDWWLTMETGSANPVTRDAALDLLIRRLGTGELSDGRIIALVERGLTLQGDVNQPWVPQWGDLIEKARGLGKVKEEQFQRHARQAPQMFLDVRSQVRRGDPFPIIIGVRKSRVGMNSQLQLEYSHPLSYFVNRKGDTD